MVLAYLLILTGVVGYACWRGYQLEVWAGELAQSVDHIASRATRLETYPDRLQTLERKVWDEQLKTKLDPFLVSDSLAALSGRLDKLVDRVEQESAYCSVFDGGRRLELNELRSRIDRLEKELKLTSKPAKKPRGKK